MLLICAFAPFLLLFALGHDWLMRKFINYAYIYNVSWEDPRMDQQVRPLCCGMLRSLGGIFYTYTARFDSIRSATHTSPHLNTWLTTPRHRCSS